jgi:S-DNA-T family DNA segregation ATPase FtsK/SpoIIIE
MAGANWLFAKKIFSLSRNLRYVIVGLLYFSVTLSFLAKGSPFSWGGAVGDMLRDWLVRFLGTIGTAAVLFLGGLAYFIWRFNPVFKVPRMPERKKRPEANENLDIDEGPKLFIEKNVENGKANLLKSESGIVVIPPKTVPIVEPEHELTLFEKESPEEVIKPVPPTKKPEPRPAKQLVTAEGPALEIKNLSAELDEASKDLPTEKLKPILPDYEPTLDLQNYKYPSLDLLESHGSEKIIQDAGELEANKNQIINTLKNYDIDIQKISATVGPTVTLYEIVPEAGVRISRIKNLEDDIALNLAALGIRIIAPIPGKGTIGIEVPNVKKTVVSMRTLLASEKFQHSHFNLPIAIGKKIDNENFIVDLTSMPHLLMAGATGQGKSVGLNAILVSLLYKKHPSQLKLVLVDPKKVELSLYRLIEKHFLAKLPGEEEAIITDTKKVIHTLNALCIIMDLRYDLLKEAAVRNIKEYNDKFIKRKLNPEKGHEYLPFIVLVIDEFADLIMTAGKEVEMPLARLAQLARAVGIHLIIATQRPSVNIITGTIKANFPARIAFKVSSKIDSRTILDMGGAEQLIGKGDMLVSYNGEVTRLQCAFVDTPEVEEIVEFIGKQQGYPMAFLLPEYIEERDAEGKEFDLHDKDPLFEEAARLIVQNQVGSTSLIQRRMKLGYNRAGRLMDQLEFAGVVGPSQGSKARDVLIKSEMELDQYLQSIG